MIRTVTAALALIAAVLFSVGPVSAAAPRQRAVAPHPAVMAPAQGAIVQKITVQGNQRIEESTVLSYMVVKEGQPYTQAQIDQSLKTLYATGLFSDVTIT